MSVGAKAMKLNKLSATIAIVISIAILFWVFSRKAETPNPLPKFVLGKGIWIYRLEACESGDVSKIVEKAQWAKLDYLLIKTHDGSKWVDYNRMEKIEQLVNALHAVGIKAYAWGYVYGTYSDEESKRAIEALDMGFDGYVFNAEIHMRNRDSAALHQCLMLRSYIDAQCPAKILGYSTFCRVQNQEGIPFEIYDKYCDVAMPQVYFSWFSGWDGGNAPVRTMNIWLQKQATWAHPAKPIIPTLEASNGSVDMPATSPRELRDAAKGFRGYFGCNFYSWDVANDRLWKVIRDAPGNLDYQRQHNAEKAWAIEASQPLPKPNAHHLGGWTWFWLSFAVIWLGGIPIYRRRLFGRQRLHIGHRIVLTIWPIILFAAVFNRR